ncbi:MAG: hypothetical protein IKB75_07230 [Clostridia bacterium]|nr:hypothetical protein [Clostridia bacterium]
MKKPQNSTVKALIHIAYWLPLVTFLTLLIYAAIPHLYLVVENKPLGTISYFQLLINTWEQAFTAFGASDTPVNQSFFSYITLGYALLSWACIAFYGVFSILCAVCTTRAFAADPTSQESNRAKAIFRILCPNRICFFLFQILPILQTLLPTVLVLCFEEFTPLMGKIHIHYLLLPDWLLAVIAILVTVTFFCALLPSQNSLHRDMFRLYKAKKQKPE